MTKWTEEKVLEVVAECRAAAINAGQSKLSELQQDGPKWAVCNEDGTVAGQLLDVCGYAWNEISARGKFFQTAKKLSKDRGLRFNCSNAYGGGGHFAVYDTGRRQEMSVNSACCKAIAEVLSGYGLEASTHSRID